MNEPKKKRTRTRLRLATKLKILGLHKEGKTNKEIKKCLGLNSDIVRIVIKRAADIEQMAESMSEHADAVTNKRCPLVERMERLLVDWIKERQTVGEPTNGIAITQKAKSLHAELVARLDDEARRAKVRPFVGSKGWFYKFSRRFGYRRIVGQGEPTFGDGVVARDFAQTLKPAIVGGGYTPRQLFNASETGVSWKFFGSRERRYVDERTGRVDDMKSWTDWLKLIVGANAAGDKKLRPLVAFKTANPKSLAGVDVDSLPVIWRPSKHGGATREIVREWFARHFVPETSEYCAREGIPFKILLLLDEALASDIDFDSMCPNVRVVAMSPEVASFLEPMRQGVGSLLRTNYVKNVKEFLREKCEGEGKPSLPDAWRSFNMAECIHNLARSWHEISPECMNSAWRNLYPEAVYADYEFKSVVKRSCATSPSRDGFEAPARIRRKTIEPLNDDDDGPPTKSEPIEPYEDERPAAADDDDFEWPLHPKVETKVEEEAEPTPEKKVVERKPKKARKKRAKRKRASWDVPLEPLDMAVFDERDSSSGTRRKRNGLESRVDALASALDGIASQAERMMGCVRAAPSGLRALELYSDELRLIESSLAKCYDDVKASRRK